MFSGCYDVHFRCFLTELFKCNYVDIKKSRRNRHNMFKGVKVSPDLGLTDAELVNIVE